jgi:dTDP-L-rhamnose 4-epimerase
MKNILITGGAGFIGSNLAIKLINKGYTVTVLDNLSPQIHTDNPENSLLYQTIKGKVHFIKGTVTSRKDWLEALRGQHIVVHLAAETGTGQSMYEIEKYNTVNISGTALFLDILTNTKHSIEKVVIASSRSIYGEGKYFSEELNAYVYPKHRLPEDMDKGVFEVSYKDCIKPLAIMPTDEESKIHPSSVYGITKQVQEQLIMTVCSAIGIEPVAFRYQNVYGPGQSLSNPYTGILSIFSNLIRNGQGINIFEDGKESRDFVFIDDVTDATILGIERAEAANDVFNVGYGTPTDVMTVAQTLINNYGFDVPLTISGNYRLGDIRHNYADLSKIKSKLGFTPQYDFEKGIALFCDWVKQQNPTNIKYSQSLEEMKQKGLFK